MSKDIIEYLERLALISFTREEREKLIKELNKIIEMFNLINSVEGLDKWEPLYHVHDIPLTLREDDVVEGIDSERSILKDNAILVEGYVKAPKTVTE
ncbi:MAG: Asp-tRNA(Asn)/Glu-tRNA(Gln) amidotransferase subunit GatC [Desulfurococcaceae archaeon]|jgi:aspartyl/glutamyl-tRNA(Asn/Gln) amidotransferase C subunit|nr:Asp-tRNA(Asn)/Glu-tRNA(Gln) amidotransferase subunit GatC [Desulfurococcaceae archaeon]MCC6057970.1 Asp-tRNA(Asn)/Glu-tRNA(Gln) amidotransferase subunit GatC [Desulfurococcaceae archaeon]